MVSCRVMCLVSLAFVVAMAGPFGSPSGTLVSQAATFAPLSTGSLCANGPNGESWAHCYALTDYRASEYGVQADLYVPASTAQYGSAVAMWVGVIFPNNGWIQTGWVNGWTPNGITFGKTYLYWEWCTRPGTDPHGCTPGGYSFTLSSSPVTVGTTHSFQVSYSDCDYTRNLQYWAAVIDGVFQGGGYLFPYKYGTLEVSAELHNTHDIMQTEHVTNLIYWKPYMKGYAWFAWDGYGRIYVDSPPFAQTINSNTAWDCRANA